MDAQRLFQRYQELQRYVGWRPEDALLIQSVAPLVEPHFPELVADFYEEIERHPDAQKVITGGQEQVQRLKGTLIRWLQQLFSGIYDEQYVMHRWQIGYRHVEIGLDQVYTNMALSRLRRGLMNAVARKWPDSTEKLIQLRTVLHTLIDLDLALIEDAYQSEYTFRKQATERLALIGQVAGGVAHELRNPLNVIKTSVFYLLNARNAPESKVAQHLERIERQVGIADDVIVALVSFAKMALPHMQPFNVEACLQDVIASTDWPHGVQVEIKSPANLPAALADAGQIRIVLSNLIRNAIDAMPEGGTLTLSTAEVDQFVEISIVDTGCGIEPDNLKRIMEPFYSTKTRGIGLGLPMAKAIVEKNEGRLMAESKTGRGSRFTVRLRAVPHAAAH